MTPEEAVASAADCLLAIHSGDERGLRDLLEPDGPLACVLDLWGLPGLRLYTAFGVGQPIITALACEGPRGRVLACWSETQGCRLDLRAHPRHGLVYAATPSLADDTPMAPDFALAETGGMRLAWRSPAREPVEALLRERGTARLLGPTALVARILLWRLALKSLRLPVLPPAIWAAAMEYQTTRTADPTRAADLACQGYGITRRELERAVFLLEAGWRLKAAK